MQAHPQRLPSIRVSQPFDHVEVILIYEMVTFFLRLFVLFALGFRLGAWQSTLVDPAVFATEIGERILRNLNGDLFFQRSVTHDNDVVLCLGFGNLCANLYGRSYRAFVGAISATLGVQAAKGCTLVRLTQ